MRQRAYVPLIGLAARLARAIAPAVVVEPFIRAHRCTRRHRRSGGREVSPTRRRSRMRRRPQTDADSRPGVPGLLLAATAGRIGRCGKPPASASLHYNEGEQGAAIMGKTTAKPPPRMNRRMTMSRPGGEALAASFASIRAAGFRPSGTSRSPRWHASGRHR
jgi:hypothetical protein